jgi:LuxR family maltose regulon positive regulatory protein
MSAPILATKLYIPPPRPDGVRRPRLTERLNEGLRAGRKLTLVSAPAGFGKTTLVGQWIAGCGRAVAWLSLDAGDTDLTRFLTYLVAALRTVAADVGTGTLGMLRSPQPPPGEAILTTLLNEINAVPDAFVLVLDDYHVLDVRPVNGTRSVDAALTFLLDHLPPQMHLVIVTREDPALPLARYRVRGQLSELRVADLRFTPAEASEFLTRAMGLSLSPADVAALEARTEGWIAGLQLAGLAMQGTGSGPDPEDTARFIASFTGSHRFVMDYLVEEVLHRQPRSIQTFLLRTSILDRLYGPLCDAVLDEPAISGRETLEALEQANLFIVPLDDERRWYRYHRLFAELLRQRLHQSVAASPEEVTVHHRRASEWYAENGWALEAFHHAIAAGDVARAARLVEGRGKAGTPRMPLHFRGAVTPVLTWLASLPDRVMDDRPALWVMYASALSMTGQLAGVEEKLQAAEVALQGAPPDEETRNLIGHIAAIRALLAASQYEIETIIAQSRRALEYLHPDNLAVRTATTWKMGIAHQLQGDRKAARRAFQEALATGEASGNTIITLSATIGLGQVQEADTQLHRAAQTYRRAIDLAGDPLGPGVSDAYLGLARILYQWNDLEAAQARVQRALELAQRIENADRAVEGQVFLSRLKLAQGDVTGAAALLTAAARFARRHHFARLTSEVAAAQVRLLLQRGDLAAAARLAQAHELPLSRARVHLAQGDPDAALATLEPLRQQAVDREWPDERLRVTALQALALDARGARDEALRRLREALALAAPGGFVRLFVDAGTPMARLLSAAAVREGMPDYVAQLLAAFEAEGQKRADVPPPPQPLVEPLTPRELEVLALIAQGLSNREIGERLFIALNTVKGHTRRIYGKLGVKNRTQAVHQARSLRILPLPPAK